MPTVLQQITRQEIHRALDAADGTSLLVWALLLSQARCSHDPATGQITCPGLQQLLHAHLGRPPATIHTALQQLPLPALAHLALLLCNALDATPRHA